MTSSALAYRLALAQAGEDAAESLIAELRAGKSPFEVFSRVLPVQLAAEPTQRNGFYRTLALTLAMAKGHRG